MKNIELVKKIRKLTIGNNSKFECIIILYSIHFNSGFFLLYNPIFFQYRKYFPLRKIFAIIIFYLIFK